MLKKIQDFWGSPMFYFLAGSAYVFIGISDLVKQNKCDITIIPPEMTKKKPQKTNGK